MTKRISRKSFAARLERLTDELRRRIMDGTYAEGDFLPSESSLAKQFELSNNSVRKGLDTLAAEGLIVKLDKVGSRVTAPAVRPKTTITIICMPSIERDLEFSRLLEDFHKLHPSIHVKPVAWSMLDSSLRSSPLDTIRTYLEDGTADLITINHNHFIQLIENGCADLLEPLDYAEGTYRFLTDAFSADGNLYAQPVVFSPVVLCYNKDHFAEAGLPEPDSGWTWERLIDAAEKLTVPGSRHGFHFYQVSENRWPLFLLQGGKRRARPDEPDWERMMDGIDLCGSIIQNRHAFPPYLSESEPEASQLFISGKISMQLATYNSLNDLKHSAVRYDIAPVPYMDVPATLLIAIGLMASRRSKAKEAVKLFVDYTASVQAQQWIRSRTLTVPACKPVAEAPPQEDTGLNRPQHDQIFREIMPSYRWHTDLGVPIRLLGALHHPLKLYWSEMIDRQTLLSELRRLRPGSGQDEEARADRPLA
ncbi:extracellular solute-binding protein [Paenibacillus oceani]|uniref:Extracellular solute-binding protein n=1 Tax=Paenibacillus oceani TaxID=2772510 RepID=A0A927CBT2_9BACL|nr:extracellular solute-binding protein [Paenibacillus oceani]MBD2863376.1 extracellular solute-binding protein [Paenibacillus oceani]